MPAALCHVPRRCTSLPVKKGSTWGVVLGGSDALEGGEGDLKGGGGGGGGLAGTPLLPGTPYGPRRRRAENFEDSILLALKTPKQNFGCQPQTFEGDEGGGGVQAGGYPLPSCGVRPF